jgi:hypothetical protein
VDTRPKDNKPTYRIRVCPAATDRPWQALWDWLLAPSEQELAVLADATVESGSNHDGEEERDGH